MGFRCVGVACGRGVGICSCMGIDDNICFVLKLELDRRRGVLFVTVALMMLCWCLHLHVGWNFNWNLSWLQNWIGAGIGIRAEVWTG